MGNPAYLVTMEGLNRLTCVAMEAPPGHAPNKPPANTMSGRLQEVKTPQFVNQTVYRTHGSISRVLAYGLAGLRSIPVQYIPKSINIELTAAKHPGNRVGEGKMH